jgi:5,10-methylene-tetrahydrofolate dehydrogenase/methenyl tetrahydrofolate cyclohydrolase
MWGGAGGSSGSSQSAFPAPCVQAALPELQANQTSAPGSGYNVAVLGAAGGIGQPLSLLLKL